MHEKVGLLDMTAFAKFEVAGPAAEAWLDGLLANRIPTRIGRMALCDMLARNGGVRSEFTVFRAGPESFYLVSADAVERHDFDYLRKALPTDGSGQRKRWNTFSSETGSITNRMSFPAVSGSEWQLRVLLSRSPPLFLLMNRRGI